jgi:cytochrome c-type biogenesis protein CcmH/NrfF
MSGITSAVAVSPPARPTPEELQAESLTRDIAAEMPSPYCPGRSISSCPTEAARELEDDILDLAKQGNDREQIEAVLVARFGEEKMGKAHENEVLVAILVGAALALVVIVYTARRWLRPAPSAAAATSAGAAPAATLAGVNPSELDRLEAELDDLD